MNDSAAIIKHLEARVEYLEEINRYTLDALEMASFLGDFQENITKLETPDIILKETSSRVMKLIQFKAVAFYMIEQHDSDFVLFNCDPVEFEDFFQRESSAMIENGNFARSVDEKRPLIVYSSDFSQHLLMHVITNAIRIRGMFIGLLGENAGEVQEISLGLLSIVLNNSANALECYDLYQTINGINQEMADKVERLAESERELKRHRYHLEELVAERAAELSAANKQLKQEIEERKKAWELSRKYEAQLQQAKKLQAIGTLAGGIAHDFNNIMCSIMGYADMALELSPENSPTHRYLSQVLTAGHRAKELIKQILTFSQQQEQEIFSVPVHNIIKEVIQLMQSRIPQNIYIRFNPDPNSIIIPANPTQVHRILMNLCSNAIYAMKESGGCLTISTYHDITGLNHSTALSLDNINAYCGISIRDNGRGMDQDILHRIFDPFFTTKPPGDGFGMGLPMVHGMIKSLKGEIIAESQPNQGAVFYIFLPRMNN